jgi:hypothetical protein
MLASLWIVASILILYFYLSFFFFFFSCFNLLTLQWLDIMNHAKMNADSLKDMNVIKRLSNIIKTNVRVCLAVGPGTSS